jgi:SnoaL-like domain
VGDPLTWTDNGGASGLAGAHGEQFKPPLRETVPHISDRARVGAVFGERGAGDLRQRPECTGEQQPVEAVIGCCREFQQLLTRGANKRGVAMTKFAPHRAAWESFIDCMHGDVDKDTLTRLLAENVVLNSPFSDEPLTGREAVMEAMQTVHRLTTDLTYKEILSGETHHAAFFRLQIEGTVIDGMDYARLDADGKVAEVTIWWRPLPSAVEMPGRLAHGLGMQPWELRTNGE